MNKDFSPYALRAEGKIHSEDTRYVSCSNNSDILSASRDSTACVSSLTDRSDDVTPARVFIGHQAFVNFVLYHAAFPLLGDNECFISGSNDNHVVVWDANTGTLEAVLDGHSKGVACGTLLWNVPLNGETPSYDGDILTGDWAGTCIIFDCVSGKAKQVYDKHGVAIRGVVQLPQTALIVSGSGDKTAHVWNALSGETVQICKFHADVVQCVCAIDSATFATGSNDCSIAVWKVGINTPFCVLEGHTSLVYGLSWNKYAFELLSCSEDRTVIVWGDRTLEQNLKKIDALQAIPHPTLVWSVCAMPCGDFLTGTSDGYVRVWTQRTERMASQERITQYNENVASQKIDPRTNSAEVFSGSLPIVNDLDRFEGREGAKKMFKNNNGEVELYIRTAGKWEKLGIVVSGPDEKSEPEKKISGPKKNYNGKEYDYLFDIDANKKMLQLPYNRGESVIAAAQKFINENPTCCSMNHFEEIRDFIINNISEEDRKLIPMAQPIQKVEIIPFTTFERLTTFNFHGAQYKVNNVLGESSSFSSLMEAVYNGEDCSERLFQLCTELPVGSRFPAIDALRFSLYRKDMTSDTILLVCDKFFQLSIEFLDISNPEKTVMIQFITAVIEIISREEYLHIQSKIAEMVIDFLEKTQIICSQTCNNAPQVEKAIVSFLRNCSLLIVNSLSGQCSSIEHLDMLGTFLMMFCMSAFPKMKYPILATLLTLYNSSEKLFIHRLADASSLGKDLLPQLRISTLESEDSEVRRVCVLLMELL